ncbi:MAG: hypothetical protein K0R20_2513 [Actinomycetia bacterium]|jgi:hypothetical protein|nr:hypothetical protein [Actinomycetes bacterium]
MSEENVEIVRAQYASFDQIFEKRRIREDRRFPCRAGPPLRTRSGSPGLWSVRPRKIESAAHFASRYHRTNAIVVGA